jgi:hypothetical protein
MAVCAFVVPAIASADSFILDSGTFPNTQVFDSPSATGRWSFTIPAIPSGWTCQSLQFDISVLSASLGTVNPTPGFGNCHGTGAGVNCTVTPTGTRFPWTVTPSTTNLQIHNILFDITFENTPGRPVPVQRRAPSL